MNMNTRSRRVAFSRRRKSKSSKSRKPPPKITPSSPKKQVSQVKDKLFTSSFYKNLDTSIENFQSRPYFLTLQPLCKTVTTVVARNGATDGRQRISKRYTKRPPSSWTSCYLTKASFHGQTKKKS